MWEILRLQTFIIKKNTIRYNLCDTNKNLRDKYCAFHININN